MQGRRGINVTQKSKIQTVEISYLRGGCGVSRFDSENNESAYGRFGMFNKVEGMSSGVLEVMKRSTLRWFGHMERMGGSEISQIYKICKMLGV